MGRSVIEAGQPVSEQPDPQVSPVAAELGRSKLIRAGKADV